MMNYNNELLYHYEKNNGVEMNTSSSLNNLVYDSHDDDGKKLRRVQSEKKVYDECIDDVEIDRLSHYENLDVDISFPETDDDLSDQQDELLLIEHLNICPKQNQFD